MLYQSLKLTNGIWILAELRIQPGNPNYTVLYGCLNNNFLHLNLRKWYLWPALGCRVLRRHRYRLQLCLDIQRWSLRFTVVSNPGATFTVLISPAVGQHKVSDIIDYEVIDASIDIVLNKWKPTLEAEQLAC